MVDFQNLQTLPNPVGFQELQALADPPTPVTTSQRQPLQGGVTDNAPPINLGKSYPNTWHLEGYVFDAWLKLHHSNSLTITQHPVQTGAQVSDHAFVNARKFSFEIGMTDCARSIIAGQFPASPTRSINAYNTLVTLQASGKFLELLTKYTRSSQILIESIDVSDDFSTSNAMHATINLMEIIVADTQVAKVSAIPQVTDSTNRGQVNPALPFGTWPAVLAAAQKVGKDASGLFR